MKRKKILVFLPHLSGGGAERVTLNIMKQLNIKEFDLTLVVLTKHGHLLKFIPDNINLIELNVKKTMFSFIKLRKIINEINPDVIFSSLFRSHIALYFSLLGKKNKPKIILRSPNSPKLLIKRGELSILMKKLLDLSYSKADLVIAQTPEMKIEISDLHSIEKNKIQVLINPIDKKLIDEKVKDIDNPFKNDSINIVAAGRLIKQKGFDILIKSLKKVIDINKNFKLYIIGEDVIGEKKNLKKLIKEYSLESHIEFLGFKNNPYQYFYFSDVYVLSSRWEGLPNTVLENLYLEKAIIATKCIPFMNSIIDDGKNGLLVDVENIEQLSNAILNFKSIKPKKFDLQNSNFENIFR